MNMRKCEESSSTNNVKVTLDLPIEAAERLEEIAALASSNPEGAAILRELGIWALQVEGEQALSLKSGVINNKEDRNGPSSGSSLKDKKTNCVTVNSNSTSASLSSSSSSSSSSSISTSITNSTSSGSSPLLVNLLKKEEEASSSSSDKKIRRKPVRNVSGKKGPTEDSSASSILSHPPSLNPAEDRPSGTTVSYVSGNNPKLKYPSLMPPPQGPFNGPLTGGSNNSSSSYQLSAERKKRQILINPNTGHLEPGPGESSSEGETDSESSHNHHHNNVGALASSEHSNNDYSTSVNDKALKLKLKLPVIPSSPGGTEKLITTGVKRPREYPTTPSSDAEGVPKIPKLILSMKDKTVKMAEKGEMNNCESEDSNKRLTMKLGTTSSTTSSTTNSGLGTSGFPENNSVLSYSALSSPIYQSHNQHDTEEPSVKKLKRPTKKLRESPPSSSDRLAAWTKSLGVNCVSIIDNNGTSDDVKSSSSSSSSVETESWKEVLESRVKQGQTIKNDMVDHKSDLPGAFQGHSQHNNKNISDEEFPESAKALEIKSIGENNKSSNEMGSPSLPRDSDLHQGHQGEDSGIESMDALSEKSPNQGDNPFPNEEQSSTNCDSSNVTTSISVANSLPPKINVCESDSIAALSSTTATHSSVASSKNDNSSISSSSSSTSSSPVDTLNEVVRSSSSTPEIPVTISANPTTSESSRSVLGTATALRSALATSVPPGAKMVPVKLVTVSGEGNLRLVRVSPLKNTAGPTETTVVNSNSTTTSTTPRTVVIKSSMIKNASTSSAQSELTNSSSISSASILPHLSPSLLNEISTTVGGLTSSVTTTPTPSTTIVPTSTQSSSSSSISFINVSSTPSTVKTKESSSSSSSSSTVVDDKPNEGRISPSNNQKSVSSLTTTEQPKSELNEVDIASKKSGNGGITRARQKESPNDEPSHKRRRRDSSNKSSSPVVSSTTAITTLPINAAVSTTSSIGGSSVTITSAAPPVKMNNDKSLLNSKNPAKKEKSVIKIETELNTTGTTPSRIKNARSLTAKINKTTSVAGGGASEDKTGVVTLPDGRKTSKDEIINRGNNVVTKKLPTATTITGASSTPPSNILGVKPEERRSVRQQAVNNKKQAAAAAINSVQIKKAEQENNSKKILANKLGKRLVSDSTNLNQNSQNSPIATSSLPTPASSAGSGLTVASAAAAASSILLLQTSSTSISSTTSSKEDRRMKTRSATTTTAATSGT